MKHPLAYLCDILNECEFITHAVGNKPFDEFISDPVLTRAVERSLEIIGEASGKIPNTLKQKYSHIPWRYIKGLRNIIVHEYSKIDHSIIWKIATDNIPPLYKDLKAILTAEGWKCE